MKMSWSNKYSNNQQDPSRSHLCTNISSFSHWYSNPTPNISADKQGPVWSTCCQIKYQLFSFSVPRGATQTPHTTPKSSIITARANDRFVKAHHRSTESSPARDPRSAAEKEFGGFFDHFFGLSVWHNQTASIGRDGEDQAAEYDGTRSDQFEPGEVQAASTERGWKSRPWSKWSSSGKWH